MNVKGFFRFSIGLCLGVASTCAYAQMPNQAFLNQKGMTSVNLAKEEESYSVQVPVTSQSSAELPLALNQALKQVLVQVSHDNKIITEPRIQKLLANPSSLIKQFNYQSQSHADKSSSLVLVVKFDPSLIDKAIQTTLKPNKGLSAATNENISVFTLIAINPQEPQAQAEQVFLAAHSDQDYTEILREQAKQRGLNLVLPVMDLTDIKMLPPQKVLNLNMSAITSAAKRYGAKQIWLGLFMLQGQQWHASWSVVNLQGNVTQSWQDEADSVDSLIAQGSAKFAALLASGNAFGVHQALSDVKITVTNIKNFADFASVVAYLKRFDPVQNVEIINASGHRLELKVMMNGGEGELKSMLSDQHRLVAISAENSQNALVYQWAP